MHKFFLLGAALSCAFPVASGAALASVPAAANSPLRCPAPLQLDVGFLLCVKDGRAHGPFPESMVRKCEAAGGGEACKAND